MKNLTRKTAVTIIGLTALAVIVTATTLITLPNIPLSDMTDEIMVTANNPNITYDNNILETAYDGHDLEEQTDVETEIIKVDDEHENELVADGDSRLSNPDSNNSSNSRNAVSTESEHDITVRATFNDSPNTVAHSVTPDSLIGGHAEASNTSSCPIAIINEVRSEHGLSALPTNAILNEAAQVRANEVASGTWGHTRPCGRTWQTAVHDMGYTTGRSSAENISGNAFDGWRRSPGHLEWVLRSDWTHMGVAQSGNITVAIFMNGGTTPIEIPNAEPPPQNTITQPIETQQPTQETAPQPAPPPPPTEQTSEPITGFDCPQPYYLCYCVPGNPCSP